MISRSPTSTIATTVISFLNQRYTKNHMFQEEFVNLGAICQAEPEGGSRGLIYIEIGTEIIEGLRG